MGNMTVVSIMEDAWGAMKANHDKFIKNIDEGMHEYDSKRIHSYPVSCYANHMTVHQSFHDSIDQVLLAGHGYMYNITEMDESANDKAFFLKHKAQQLEIVKCKLEEAERNMLIYTADFVAECAAMDGITEPDKKKLLVSARKHNALSHIESPRLKSKVIDMAFKKMGGTINTVEPKRWR